MGEYPTAVALGERAIALVDPVDDPIARRRSTSDSAGISGRRAISRGRRGGGRGGARLVPTDPPSAARARILAHAPES